MKPKREIHEDDHVGYPGALQLDIEKFKPYVDHFDISEERKIELLQCLWDMMTTFVRLGWGLDSEQSADSLMRAHWEASQKQKTLGSNSGQSNSGYA